MKPQNKEMGCDGKRRYQSRIQAERYVAAFHALGIDSGLNAYACVFCDRWHIGHRLESDARRARKARAQAEAVS